MAANVNSTISIGVTINSKQADLQFEALKEKIDRTKQSLEEMQQKLLDPNQWGSDETAETIKADIKRQEKDLKSMQKMYDERAKMIKGIEEVLSEMSEASYNELTRTRGLMLSAIRGLDPTTEKYQEKVEQLQQLQEEIAERQRTLNNRMTDERAAEVLAKPGDYSTDELKEAIEVTRKLQSAQQIGKDEWENYGKAINNAENLLHHYNSEAKKSAMSSRLATIDTASPASLSEQKRYWQEMVRANPAIEEYKTNLQEVVNVERERIKVLAEQSMAKVNEEDYSESIEDMQQRLKLLREYRNIMERKSLTGGGFDADTYKEVDAAIDRLNKGIQESQQGFLSMEDAIHKAMDVDNFRGTLDELEKLKKRLEEIRAKELKIGGEGSKERLEEIEKALFKVEGKIANTNRDAKTLDQILDNMGDASLSELVHAASQLEKEINDCGTASADFVRKTSELRRVNKWIDQTKAKFKEKESIIARTSKRLASYVAIYAGFNEVVGWMKRMISGNLALSDSLADVQKTTGLTSKEINRLSDSIRGLDTRTTTEELHELAATAGQIGLTSTDDVFEFVKAANMINVALAELGSEGVASLMKVADATGEVKRLGVERALLAVGSSINELSANSAASAPAIVDMVRRLGAISVSARMSSADLAAIGATTDALAQSTEVAGTALSMFIGTLVSKTGQVAKAVGVEEEYLQGLINQGKTTEAMIAVFEKMKDMDEKSGLAALTPIMKDLGSEGQRMTNTLTLMATKVDFLKEQVELSRTAFSDATSIINEYNIKNEDAAAILQRIINSVEDFFTRAEFVEGIKKLLIEIYKIPQAVEENKTTIITALSAISVQLALVKAQMLGLQGTSVMKMFATLKIEFAALTQHARALFTVIGKHPFLTVAAGLSVLGAKIYDSYKKNDLYGNSQERLNELGKQWRKEMTEELRTSRTLFTQLKNSEKGTREYYAAKKAILDNYGGYLEGMGKEVENLENIEAAQDAVTRAINRTVYARIAQQGLADAEAAYAKTTGDAYEEMFNKLTKSGKYTEEQAMLVVERFRTILEQGKELPKDLQDIVSQFRGQVAVGTSSAQTVQWVESNPLQVWVDQVRRAGEVFNGEKQKIEARYGSLKNTLEQPIVEPDNGTGGNGKPEPMTDEEYKAWVREQKRQAKEQHQAAISALEAYYNERETLIRKKGLEEGKTQVQINQELDRLQTEKLNDEIQLRKMLLDEYWEESTFDPSKYKGVLSGMEYFSKKDLTKLREQLKLWGVAMEDGLKRQLTDREVKLSEQALKLREKINKILLQDDFNEQVAQQFRDDLQELGMLFNLNSIDDLDQTKADGEARLAYMREWSKESYNLNAQQLQAKIEQETLFSKWRFGRTTEDYEALLIQLRKFHDDEAEADKKAAERRKKIFENSQEYIKMQEEQQKKIQGKETDAEMWDRFQGIDLVTEDTTDEAQIAIYQARIDASRAYIEQLQKQMEMEILSAQATVTAEQAVLDALKAAGLATDEQEARVAAAVARVQSLMNQQSIIISDEEANVAENQQNILDRYMAIEQRKIQEAKKYTDAIVEFSGQMGEAAFGEVEDRKEAGKQLIKTLLTTLKDWAQVKLTELVMQQMFAQQSTAISGQQVGQELGMTAAKTSADIAAGTASATAKEAGSKGFIGLAIGAAIGAALSALLGLALGAINKSKTEVQSISGTGGRLATGMLTYAEGNYPVLGNDGNVYNAKYEGSGMKTGIYRGGAHFGIFSEKKPEAIIDGDTTQRLIMNHPDIWKAIVTLSKNGRLDSGMGMRTFATGNIDQLAKQASQAETQAAAAQNEAQNAMMERMEALLAANVNLMNKLATEGVQSRINMYGDDGLYKNMEKAKKYANRVGYR